MNRPVLLLVLLLSACSDSNPGYQPPPGPEDMPGVMPGPDLLDRGCPSYLHAGGGGRDRPQVLVPGGPYQIGSAMFNVPDFYLDVFLVTVGAYRECYNGGAGLCSKPATDSPYCNWTDMAGTKEDHPINCVTWAQMNTFCKMFAGAERRLPYEYELEYAAAGPRQSEYAWGNTDPQPEPMAQLCWNRYSNNDMRTPLGTCPVDGPGSHGETLLGSPTCRGVADLAGNVWEWTATEWKFPYAYPETMCSPASPNCSFRGGSWDDFDTALFAAAFRRGREPAAFEVNYVGARCARTK